VRQHIELARILDRSRHSDRSDSALSAQSCDAARGGFAAFAFHSAWHNCCRIFASRGNPGEMVPFSANLHARIFQVDLRGIEMKQPATRELFDYWNCLRGDRAAPDRAEIDPAAIRNVLADTFMLEVDADHQFPIRLSGSRFNALFCCEKKGHSFIDMWSAEEARKIAAVLLTVIDAACPFIAAAAAAPEGYPEQKLELLFLPLRHGAESKARILGSLSLLRKPAWLGLLPVDALALGSLQKVDGSAASVASAPNPNPFRPAPCVPHGGADFETRGHLRVFRGGR
jgi:hypothetical protein